jgi:two-component system sensor histidine kinase DesK
MNQRIGNLMRAPAWRWAGPVFALAWLAVLAVAFAASDDASAWRLAMVGAGLAVFCGLFMVVVLSERPPWVPVAGMLAAAAVLTLTADESFAVMFGYVASALGAALHGRHSVLAVGGVTALAAATLSLTTPEGAVFWGISAAVLGAGTLWLLIGGLLRANASLREARAELAELAVAEERLRFARDLHDLLGHDLSLIAIKAELAGRLLPGKAGQAAGAAPLARHHAQPPVGDHAEARRAQPHRGDPRRRGTRLAVAAATSRTRPPRPGPDREQAAETEVRSDPDRPGCSDSDCEMRRARALSRVRRHLAAA